MTRAWHSITSVPGHDCQSYPIFTQKRTFPLIHSSSRCTPKVVESVGGLREAHVSANARNHGEAESIAANGDTLGGRAKCAIGVETRGSKAGRLLTR